MKEEARMIDDDEVAHSLLASRFDLIRETHPTKETKGIADDKNPMEPINEVNCYLAGFIGAHNVFSREELQGWLNLFCFYWNTYGSAFKKAQAFIELAVKKRTIVTGKILKISIMTDFFIPHVH